MRPLTYIPLLGSVALVLAGCGSSTPSEPVEPDYALEVRWLGDAPSAPTQLAFNRAVSRIKSIIVGGLTPVQLPADFNVEQCNAELTGYPDVPQQTVQGLIIYVLVEPIDGPGQVLGSAGPCLVRGENRNKPALGVMRLDQADLQSFSTQERLDALILHETLHVVGFGTIWTDNALLTGEDTPDARFVGAEARDACAEDMGGETTCATDVPVHSIDGEGSAYSHWRETIFMSELMTPFLQVGSAPLSAMSIRSLADLGYDVDASSADEFGVAAGLRAAVMDDAGPAIALPEPLAPRFKLGANGTLTPLGRTR